MTKNVSSIVLVVVLSLNQSFFSIISVHAAEKSNNNIVANSKYKNASTYYIILNIISCFHLLEFQILLFNIFQSNLMIAFR